MEHTHTEGKIELGFREWIQIGWLIATVLFICVMIFSITVFLRNIEEVKQNPVDYAIDNSEMTFCTCYDIEGNYKDFYGSIENSNIQDTPHG